MQTMTHKHNKAKGVVLAMMALIALAYTGCRKDFEPGGQFLPKLSSYGIFTGNIANLSPSSSYNLYELSSTLFSDYAHKQRLIYIPTGKSMTAADNGLVQFPDGTIIVKTFYYLNDERDSSKGKRLMETRLLQKTNGSWTGGTYLWNSTQTDATLITAGLDEPVNWIDNNGNAHVVSYHVPSSAECGTCHNSNGAMIPIGPKARNLNRMVLRNGSSQNQLSYMQSKGILTLINSITSYDMLPDYTNAAYTLEQRARAYMDINCAHCHSDGGICGSKVNLRFDYSESLSQSNISGHVSDITSNLQGGVMPKEGITVTDTANINVIVNYLKTL
jgi:uncharacterized repeat protein (TIGR03806 family)